MLPLPKRTSPPGLLRDAREFGSIVMAGHAHATRARHARLTPAWKRHIVPTQGNKQLHMKALREATHAGVSNGSAMCARKRGALEPPPSEGGKGVISVLVETRKASLSLDSAQRLIEGMRLARCTLDKEFEPVAMEAGRTTIVRCHVASERVIEELRRQPDVVAVWNDTPIAPFGGTDG